MGDKRNLSLRGEYRQFDLFIFANCFYALPFTRVFDWDTSDPDTAQGMLRGRTLDQLKSTIDDFWSGDVPEAEASPHLFQTYKNHNIIGFLGTYYCVPFGVPVDWAAIPDGLLMAVSQLAAHRVIDLSIASDLRARPVGKYQQFNIFYLGDRCYGVPQEAGELDLQNIDIENEPSIVAGDDPDEVRARIDKVLEGGHRFVHLNANPHHRGLSDYLVENQPLNDLGLPEIIEIEPIHSCNLRCIMCHVSYEKLSKQRLDVDKTLRHLEGVTGRWAMLSSSYEPFAHPQIADLVQGLDNLGMNIDMTTNGTLFTPKIIDRIKDTNIRVVTISFDGIRKETYESIRGRANFDVAIERIMNFKQALMDKDTFFNINQTLMRKNLPEVTESVEFWDDADFDHMGLILMRVRNENDMLHHESLADMGGEVEAALNAAARNVIENERRIVLSSSGYANTSLKEEFPENFVKSSVFSNHPGYRIPVNPRDYYQNGAYPGMQVSCRSPFKFAKINFNGDVLLCQKFKIGNINDTPFLDIWNGEEATRVRTGVLNPGNVRTCLNCQHYRFCIRAGEIDLQNQENFVALSRSALIEPDEKDLADDGNPIYLGEYKTARLFSWSGEYFALANNPDIDNFGQRAGAGEANSLMLDPVWKDEAYVQARSLDDVKAAVNVKIKQGVSYDRRPYLLRSDESYNVVQISEKVYNVPHGMSIECRADVEEVERTAPRNTQPPDAFLSMARRCLWPNQ